MRHVGLAVGVAAALMLAGSASAASQHHPRYVRHPRASAVQYAPVPPPIEGPRAYVPKGTCIQDEGYGRWTYCGQGTPGP
jgi:hypothetical protein